MSQSMNMDNFQSSYQNSGSVRETDFQRLSQNIGTNIQKIMQNVASMQRMISQIGTAQDSPQLQSQLHQIQHYTGQLAKDSAKDLKELNQAVKSGNVGGQSTSEQRQWRLQCERLQDDFTTALNSFQNAQTLAAQKEKEAVKNARKSSMLPGPGQNLIDMEESGGGSSSPAFGQSKTQMLLQEEENIAALQEREKSIRQLESDIVDVNTIFKDLATMVHEQGEVIDSIESHVDTAAVSVSEGTGQLRQAEIYKNKARKKKLILAIIGVIILAIIIGIIAYEASN